VSLVKNCGRYRVEHYSSGFEICEKCRWCEQFHKYIPDDEFYGDDFEEVKKNGQV